MIDEIRLSHTGVIDFESSAIMNEPVSPLRSLSSNEEVKYKIIVRLGFFPQYNYE